MLESPTWAPVALARVVIDGSKIYATTFGATILLGGPERMANPSFDIILHWAPWWVWGGSLAALGLVSFIPAYTSRCAAYAAISAWFWVWTAALTVNAVSSSTPVPYTGVPTYFAVATVMTAAALTLWMTRTEWHAVQRKTGSA